MCKNQQSNSPYLSQVLKHNFSINQSSNSYHLCHRKLLSHFPGYLSMGIVLFWRWAKWEPNR